MNGCSWQSARISGVSNTNLLFPLNNIFSRNLIWLLPIVTWVDTRSFSTRLRLTLGPSAHQIPMPSILTSHTPLFLNRSTTLTLCLRMPSTRKCKPTLCLLGLFLLSRWRRLGRLCVRRSGALMRVIKFKKARRGPRSHPLYRFPMTSSQLSKESPAKRNPPPATTK